MFALVDANGFYASAEKVFDPAIRDKPVVVLTNNDGCICALCDKAKALGVKKFGPYYKVQKLLEQKGAVIRSSNYELYDYLSNQMMNIVGGFAPHQHVYSIDECFLYFDNWQPPEGWHAYGETIRRAVWQQLRLPVGVGFGLTPTLAKVASHAGKRLGDQSGIAVLAEKTQIQRTLQEMSPQDVLGIGRRIAEKLESSGVRSAWELACAAPKSIRKQFSVEIERTVRELNGVTCIEWESHRPKKQQIYATRAFGHPVTDHQSLRQALCWHAERVAEKLRKQNCTVKTLTLFAHANPFAASGHYHKAVQHRFAIATADTRMLSEAAGNAADTLYKEGVLFHKCGVGAIEIQDEDVKQPDLFAQSEGNTKLMACMDAINRKYGSSTIGIAAKGDHQPWRMKRAYLSPQYTTNWRHLPQCQC